MTTTDQGGQRADRPRGADPADASRSSGELRAELVALATRRAATIAENIAGESDEHELIAALKEIRDREQQIHAELGESYQAVARLHSDAAREALRADPDGRDGLGPVRIDGGFRLQFTDGSSLVIRSYPKPRRP